eukprot:TRINITY_DN12350_c1_g1_i2.p1 TRINITY_DN12350_c1_g1~~TRINITY_DN12350_c1_g1_i2.p1  ORF type:complete len:442 (+),score=61.24 TRINITY_DN12350_c1_g1_i2:126-1451(+)
MARNVLCCDDSEGKEKSQSRSRKPARKNPSKSPKPPSRKRSSKPAEAPGIIKSSSSSSSREVKTKAGKTKKDAKGSRRKQPASSSSSSDAASSSSSNDNGKRRGRQSAKAKKDAKNRKPLQMGTLLSKAVAAAAGSGSRARRGRDEEEPEKIAGRERSRSREARRARLRSRSRWSPSRELDDNCGRRGHPAMLSAPHARGEEWQGRRRHQASFSIVYWGGVGDEGWDLDNRGRTPHFCRQCDSVVDTWRGRWDNAQTTLRMCAAEGAGFKKYVDMFLMLSARGCSEMHLPTFYQFLKDEKKKVLSERQVIGSILESYQGSITPRYSGIRTTNVRGGWEWALRDTMKKLSYEASQTGGHCTALMLDSEGAELHVDSMVEFVRSAPAGVPRIDRMLIVLGGPDGISNHYARELAAVCGEYVTLPLLRCRLPGGKRRRGYMEVN